MYKGYHNSDVVVKPELGKYKNTSLDFIDEMFEEGYRAAKEAMPEIKETLLIKWRQGRFADFAKQIEVTAEWFSTFNKCKQILHTYAKFCNIYRRLLSKTLRFLQLMFDLQWFNTQMQSKYYATTMDC